MSVLAEVGEVEDSVLDQGAVEAVYPQILGEGPGGHELPTGLLESTGMVVCILEDITRTTTE